MIRIVTDSAAHFLDPQAVTQHRLIVLPHTLQFGAEILKEEVDLTTADFFERATSSKVAPTLSAPSPEAFAALYSELINNGDEIISLHVSSKLSRTLANATQASAPYMGRNKLHLVDSLSISVGLGWLVEKAAAAVATGATAEEVVRLVRGLAHQLYAAFFVNSLSALAHAKRFSKAQAILGEMLEFKPFLSIEEGDLVPTEKMQSREQAIERLGEFAAEFADAEVKRLAILQSSPTPTPETELLLEYLAASFPKLQIPLLVYRPSLATYLGLEAMGLIIFEG